MFAVSNPLTGPELSLVSIRRNDPDQAQQRRGPPPPRLARLRLVADVKVSIPIATRTYPSRRGRRCLPRSPVKLGRSTNTGTWSINKALSSSALVLRRPVP